MTKENRLRMLILSSGFYVSITLLALTRGRSRSTCFCTNSIASRIVFMTSGIMIVYYARRLMVSEVNSNRKNGLLDIFKRLQDPWIRSMYLFERFRTGLWETIDRWFSLNGSSQYIKLLPTNSTFIPSYNCNHCHITTSARYLPFTNEWTNVDETQSFSPTTSYVEEDYIAINRSLSSPIKFYTANRKLLSDKKNNYNKLKIINVNIPLINDSIRSNSNQLISLRNVSIPRVTSIEFVSTPMCSMNDLRQSLSNTNNNHMIDTYTRTSHRNLQYRQTLRTINNSNKISISSSYHGLHHLDSY